MTKLFNDLARDELGLSGKAGKYVDSISSFCTQRYNSQTGRPTNMCKFIKNRKESVEIVKKACLELYQQKKNITVESILEHLNAINISDGTLQRQILNIMVCYGWLSKKIIVTELDRDLIIYELNNIKTKCPNLLNGKCTFNWEYAHRGRINSIIKTPPAI